MRVAVIQKSSELKFRHSLIEGHLKLARQAAWWAKSRLPFWIEFDDVHQAALLGLVEAASRFDPRRGTTFVTYARRRVYGAAIDPFRGRRYRDYQHQQLPKSPSPFGCPVVEQQVAFRDARELLKILLSGLPRREQRLIVWHYWQNDTLEQIALALRIPRIQAYELHAEVIRELRRRLSRRMHIAVRGAGRVYQLLLPPEPFN
jgi:RNA polymerase sigma factor (sigma-70 family)